uniref:Late embryogenesis abundant protein LEA-2 subgroup domain-containing protein n=1 Tax=Oryza brachyantha TaxID=4533 RepID=J3M4T9_ORYBR
MAYHNGRSPWERCKCVVKCAWPWTALAVAIVVVYIFYRPDRFYPRVDSGVLAALRLAAPADHRQERQVLHYDLAVDLSFRDAHRRHSVRNLDITATAFYGHTMLGHSDTALPSPFRQGPNNTTVHPSFRGAVFVYSDTAAELEREIASGTVHVKVRVKLSVRTRVGLVDDFHFYIGTDIYDKGYIYQEELVQENKYSPPTFMIVLNSLNDGRDQGSAVEVVSYKCCGVIEEKENVCNGSHEQDDYIGLRHAEA